MANIFKQSRMPNVPVNKFDLSHDVKCTFNMGELVPVLCSEVLPGDSWYIRPENFLRMAPLVSPVMHEIIVDTHYFFIPNRLLWAGWEDFISPPDGYTPVATPYITKGGYGIVKGDLGDYLGYPLNPGQDYQVSALPVAAYFLVYDEFYRDQNLQAEAFTICANGNNNSYYQQKVADPPYKRAWNHDYFTSCLPWAQKGDAVTLPLLNAGTAYVEHSGSTNPVLIHALGGSSLLSGDLTSAVTTAQLQADATDASIDPNETLQVDLSSDAVDITTLRTAFRMQEFLERDARGGTRYIENVYTHFGVRSSDGRFHRPEYIGGVKQKMVISEVLSQAETIAYNSNTVLNPVGSMAGHGISVGGGNTISFRAEEHGWIMGIMSVRPRTAYQDGVHKQLMRDDRFDYAWPGFAHIGEQPVTIGELYFDTTTAAERDEVFGYIPRYAEYKHMNSRVAGEFRDTLDHWHLGRQFTSKPGLNSNFIECSPDPRIFADTSGDQIYAQLIFNIDCVRRLPKFSTPSMTGSV